jgi:hypothetical protein
MMRDYRVDTGFWDHPKTLILKQQHGPSAPEALQRLWSYTARYRCKGILHGMNRKSIALAAGQPDNPAIIDTMVELHLLDYDGKTYVIHNWKKWNGFAYYADERSEQSKRAAEVRWEKKDKNNQLPNADRITDSNTECNTPSPIPTPSPKPKNRKHTASVDAEDVNNSTYITKRGRKVTGWKLRTFEDFWDTFGYKKGKAEAADSWLDISGLTEEQVRSEILPSARREAYRRQGLIDRGLTPIMAQGWLSGRRWEDEVESPKTSEVDVLPKRTEEEWQAIARKYGIAQWEPGISWPDWKAKVQAAMQANDSLKRISDRIETTDPN